MAEIKIGSLSSAQPNAELRRNSVCLGTPNYKPGESGKKGRMVARLLAVEVKVVPVKGTMVVLSRRLAYAAINRCHKPGDGDKICPTRSAESCPW